MNMKRPLIVAVVVGITANAAYATPWYDQDPAVKPNIPDFCWEEPDDPDIQCPHVALANALWYCDKTTCPDLIPAELETLSDGTGGGQFPLGLYNALTAENYLGPGGAMCSDMRRGITNWFGDHGGGLILHEECWWADDPTKPTWAFYEEQLRACEVPIIGIEWDSGGGGGHWMVGAGWDVDGEEKHLGVNDPNTGGAPGTDFYDWDLEGGAAGDGFMNFTYLGHADAWVSCILAVSQIPEPATAALLLFGGLILAKRRRR